jgi:CBS-domain-containing membrane protein
VSCSDERTMDFHRTPDRPSLGSPPDHPQRPARALEWQRIAIAFVFSFAVLALIAALHTWLDSIVVVGSLAGSVVVAFGMPKSDMARPRSLLGGHLISCLAGIVVSYVLHDSSLAGPVGVSIALLLMQSTATIHSPAGADPLIILACKGALWRPILVLVLGLLFISLLAQLCARTTRALEGKKQPDSAISQ